MSRRIGRNVILAIAFGPALLSLGPRPAFSGDEPAVNVAAREWKGIGGCASTACHNAGLATGSNAIKRNEYMIWVSSDPHQRAYSVLLEPRSKQIESLYRRAKGGSLPEKDSLCLSCHVHPDFESARHAPEYGLEDGVGCESCHGPSQDWLVPHVASGWKTLSALDKLRFGMTDTKDLATRAKICAGCHVGSKDGREVNHDLIAAGHPRLNFELSAYQAILPRHWQARDEQSRHADFEALSWVVGQLASAKSATELLETRAKSNAAPWPEFTEYDCFACHHDLQQPSGPQNRGYLGRKPGTLPWGSWSFSMLPRLAETITPNDSSAKSALSSLDRLRLEMGKTLPSRQKVVDLTRESSANLDNWLANVSNARLDEPTLTRSIDVFRDAPPTLGESSWDLAAQRYLALAAFYQARRDVSSSPRDARFESYLTTLVDGLKYPEGIDSPRGFNPKRLEEAVRVRTPR